MTSEHSAREPEKVEAEESRDSGAPRTDPVEAGTTLEGDPDAPEAPLVDAGEPKAWPPGGSRPDTHGEGDPSAEMVEEGDPLSAEPSIEPLAEAELALAERTADLQRLQAEYVNYKRRVERDRDRVRQEAIFGVLAGLLPVLDDIDRAREHGELEGGFKAVAESLERTVSGLGLTRFGTKGEEFDPNVHEALMHGHSPEVESTVIDVVAQAGYRVGDRVVRAAKVTVLGPE